jgi:hypothetical protein
MHACERRCLAGEDGDHDRRRRGVEARTVFAVVTRRREPVDQAPPYPEELDGEVDKIHHHVCYVVGNLLGYRIGGAGPGTYGAVRPMSAKCVRCTYTD